MTPAAAKPKFFATPAAFRRWLEKNHATAEVLEVGYYRKESGRPSMTWPESVDQALCFGWIDGVRHSLDDISYSSRFTPRKPRSKWSAVNIKRAQELIEAGLMQPAGLAAFERRDPEKDAKYSYNFAEEELPTEYVRVLKANPRALEFFQAQPPGYRKMMTRYVLSAQKEETRMKRLQRVVDESAADRRIDPMKPVGGDKRAKKKT
jgi:uncharacterized protein YdeI (YjbR/CyaY-like superfamily)